jgi:hypothetical protein
MCNTAAHLVDRVIPDVPVRQWVLSVPFNLRFVLAGRAEVSTPLTRIFMEETLRFYREPTLSSFAYLGGVALGGAVSNDCQCTP